MFKRVKVKKKVRKAEVKIFKKKLEKPRSKFTKKMTTLSYTLPITCSALHDEVIALGVGKDVIIYDINNLTQGEEITRMTFENNVRSIAFKSCGTLMAVGMHDDLVELRSLVDSEFKRVLQRNNDLARQIHFSLCGSFLITGSGSLTIKIWDSATGVSLATANLGSWAEQLVLLPGGQEILAGTWLCELVVIGMDGVKRREARIEGSVTALACAGDSVVVGLGDGRLQLRETARLDNVIWSSQLNRSGIKNVCVSPSGALFATASFDHNLTVVSSATGDILRGFQGHTNYVNLIFFTPDTSNVITTSLDKTVRVWHLYPEAQKCIVALSIGLTSGSESILEETLHQLVCGLERLKSKF